MHQTVYQLIGGLFNQRTQSYIIDMHLNTLLNLEQKYDEEEIKKIRKNKKIIDPTTRQGDNNAKRLYVLEKICGVSHERINEAKEEVEKVEESDEDRESDDEY